MNFKYNIYSNYYFLGVRENLKIKKNPFPFIGKKSYM